ncbi:MAG: hypothetical protein ACK5CV_10705 [Bacteroidota bacterium]
MDSIRLKKRENLHILFWLLKDACWAMEFRWMGMFMILPTFFLAALLTWWSRNIYSELMHNLAVMLWISANSLWMTGEFFGWQFRPYSAGLFASGFMLLLVYYTGRFFGKT